MDSDVASISTSPMMVTPAHEDDGTGLTDIEQDNLNTSIESSVSISVIHSIRPTQEIPQAETEKSHHFVNKTILKKKQMRTKVKQRKIILTLKNRNAKRYKCKKKI